MNRPKILRTVFTAWCLLAPMYCWSAEAKCEIKIEDVHSGTTYTVNHAFTSREGFWAERKHFDLPGSPIRCTLAFFDLHTGTMISCELDEPGHHFVQSDRSALKEKNPKNHLTFRYKSYFYVLKSSCS